MSHESPSSKVINFLKRKALNDQRTPEGSLLVQERREFNRLNAGLFRAAKTGDLEGIRKHIGKSDNSAKDQALSEAAMKGQTRAVVFLVEKGADIYHLNGLALRLARNCGHEGTEKAIKGLMKKFPSKTLYKEDPTRPRKIRLVKSDREPHTRG